MRQIPLTTPPKRSKIHEKSRRNRGILYKKLIRDKIPEIIEKEGKSYSIKQIEGEELQKAIGRKILEEAYELFQEWQNADKKSILKESADLLEITLAALKTHGYTLDDLLDQRKKRAAERGVFDKGLFLEWIGQPPENDIPHPETPFVIFNPVQSNRLIDLICAELLRSRSVCIATAFYSPGEYNLLTRALEDFATNGGELKVLHSTMGNINRPEHLTHLQEHIPEVQVRVFHPPELPFDQSPPGFHVKIWLFQRMDGPDTMLIGSSNFTKAGFTKNVEWNYFSNGEINLPFTGKSAFRSALDEFMRLWEEQSVEVTEAFLEGYRKRRAAAFRPVATYEHPAAEPTFGGIFEDQDGFGAPPPQEEIVPNEVQKEALTQLSALREEGVRKAAVIAATGIGKTYLAAFDFRESGLKNLLFIAHRENILDKSLESFRRVLGRSSFGEKLGGGYGSAGTNSDIFAMIQTLNRTEHLRKFPPGHFEYMVVDEFHHSEASTYQKVLAHFRPRFLLGLTATPERMDGRDVLRLCDYNVAYEVRLLEAVDREWLSPFQYFAIYDETDYSKIRWTGSRYDEEALTAALSNDTRTAVIANNLRKYLSSAEKIRALAFCSSVPHARFTAAELTRTHGIESAALWGDSDETRRAQTIRRLQDESDPLQVICTVDIFNEGIDIPEISHVLFLRPTQSFTVFLQQLGRGLRKAADKEFLVVLDFVGNFRGVHVAPLALRGYSSLTEFLDEKEALDSETITKELPDGCFINADTAVRRIWDQEIRKVFRKIFRSNLSRDERLKLLYQEIVTDLDKADPGLLDFLNNPHHADPAVFIRHFRGWLRTRHYCEAELPEPEKKLLDTPGEAFLYHLEMGLNPVKSYKMVVLLTLLELPGTEWKIEAIAKGFLGYFLEHPDRMEDYPDLARTKNPEKFSLKRVASHLKKMPLKYLSNTEKDFFVFDAEKETFSLKTEIIPHWKDDFFRSLVRERADYALARYFSRKQVRQVVPLDEKSLNIGFALDRQFAERFVSLPKGGKKEIRLLLEKKRIRAELKRSEDGKSYFVAYKNASEMADAKAMLMAREGRKTMDHFTLQIDENAGLRISV